MSQSRRCFIWKATDSSWYMLLGRFEYAEEDYDCDAYGPFSNKDAVEEHLQNFSNPGGGEIDDSGTESPPEKPTLSRY